MVKFSKRMDNMKDSAAVIRGLFGAMANPGMISFGGGALARESLPVDILREISQDILRKDTRGFEALSYGPVEGIKDLREVIVNELLNPKGIEADPENIMILTGGLEAMNLMCQVFIDPGDVILVESPTFVHSVEIFDMFQAKCISVEMDDDGMDVVDLEEKIKMHNPKMVYVIPTFQNPTGRTLSLERRKKVAELGSQYDVIILEDDPYRDIRYNGEELSPIKAFDKTGHTVLANSFSKIFSPGSRLGYILADKHIIDRIYDAKSATNSHTAILPQILCAEFFKRGHYREHLRMLCEVHRERRDAMMEALQKYFPEGTKWTYPDGGLFTWVELPGEINTTELLKESISDPNVMVAYVAGAGFFTDGGGKGRNSMRLCFSAVPPDKIFEGIEKLGNLIKSKLE